MKEIDLPFFYFSYLSVAAYKTGKLQSFFAKYGIKYLTKIIVIYLYYFIYKSLHIGI